MKLKLEEDDRPLCWKLVAGDGLVGWIADEEDALDIRDAVNGDDARTSELLAACKSAHQALADGEPGAEGEAWIYLSDALAKWGKGEE